MNPLSKLIIEKINKDGPITFEKFMEMALYYPELGYYSNPAVAIGRQGDFYTSPHLHPVFGAMIAKQLIEMWEILGKPSEFHAIEIGAGEGYLSKDILDHLTGRSHEIVNSLKYAIIEPFEHFEKKQRELLAEHEERVTWFQSLKNISAQINGCIFSNELPDAFPVHIVEMDNDLKEVFLIYDEGGFVEIKQDAKTDGLIDYIGQFASRFPQGYRTEINLRIREWLHEIASILSNGFLMTIDYGYTAKEYYNEERNRGTLLCYHDHQINENPYEHVGEQDITAHVNFSSVKKWGDEVGLRTLGYTSQGTYLVASGIDEMITELYAGSPDYSAEIKKIKGLIMPEGMGESHMVMIQYKGEGNPELRGFSLRNHVRKL
ncbi:MAG: SAM-dependent methyltransferase [Thermodesulfovibrionia bacterium]|nr:SAM-dependent methyltransferase [Thermodesulfovibrionia bacterium]